MINRSELLSDLQSVLRKLEADLIQRSTSPDVPEVGTWLQAEFAKASEAKRTAQNYTDWLNDYATQVAAAWVLSCVFARFLEDNGLYETPMIAGPTTSPLSLGEGQGEGRLQRAKDERELYFRQHPGLTDRDYLLHVFQTLRDLKGEIVKEVFGGHNPVNELPNWLGPDAAGVLLRFFQQIDPDTGDIPHDFTDPNWDTRFLGDLYQDLSEAARKKYALLQTPEFVEEFILDRTLDPALDEFTLTPSPNREGEAPAEPLKGNGSAGASPSRFKMIDPACGSGHFLLGTFPRILNRWQRQEPGTNVRELVQRTLDSIHGVDINPFAIAIARFRLLLAAMRACGVTRLIDAPAFRMNLVCGDSLLHVPLKSGGSKFTKGQREFDAMVTEADGEVDHAYLSEDLPELKRILKPNQYHAVVANPPYIVPKDRALNEQYRNRFESCAGKYSLAAPFLEQLFRLATSGGYTGQITANSFMKREFGKKLIESFLPTIDLTHVIDSSGAYIPGHGTPTVILFGRTRPTVTDRIRTVMGIRGEPSTPDDPSHGLVWSAIVAQVDHPGSQSEFVSVGDSLREQFYRHPWSIGGGGASELKEQIEESSGQALLDVANTAIGLVTLEDDAYAAARTDWLRRGIESSEQAGFVEGDRIRDWEINDPSTALFPHDWSSRKPQLSGQGQKLLWPLKTNLSNRLWFRKTQVERGLTWFEYGMLSGPVTSTPLSIAYGEIATHNHFVLDRGGKVFKQTAPVIKLPREASEDDHLALLGFLNSSTVCFWMKQVAHQKQMMGGDGIRIESKAKVPYAFSGTQLGKLPIPEAWKDGPLRERLLDLTRCMDQLASRLPALATLADVAGKDRDFMQVAELYRDDPAFNVLALVEGLVTAEAVPLLPILRYKDSGLRKHEEWEKTWELQRREDAVRDELEEVRRQLTLANNQEDRCHLETKIKELTTSIPVPPKYVSADFISGNHWRLRGKLDVPKERWISFPGAEAEDGSLVIAWAGYDHLQQAQAISAWYVEIRDQQGGHNDKRLTPLLAALLELLPWIKQWHNSSDNEFNMAMGDFFEGFIREESRQLPRPATEPTEPDGEDLFPDAATTITYGWSLPEIQAWKPSARRPAKRAAKKAAKKAAAPKKASKKAAKKQSDNDTE